MGQIMESESTCAPFLMADFNQEIVSPTSSLRAWIASSNELAGRRQDMPIFHKVLARAGCCVVMAIAFFLKFQRHGRGIVGKIPRRAGSVAPHFGVDHRTLYNQALA
jgi:hypothetical protein